MKNAVFWNVKLRGSCKNQRFGRTYHPHHQGDKNRSMRQLLVTANVPSSLILVNLMMEALCSSKIPVPTRATLYNISEDGIL
jgi:hypothetical protein